MSEKRANMLIKAIVEIEQACNNTNETHSDIWQLAHDAIKENARMVAEMPANVSNFVLLLKPNYKAKDGTIKQAIIIDGKYYAPQNNR